ncbi:ornithine cyclodeaminase family protein [Marimonas arenosa]|uniref:Ornithine cyclodeaminase family protein n=1 Tax=Marimonas arenosa TaxID=1795305 RepID=A0AAE3WCF7_9RHOB|nr:ornithine cyclodeaminase family protein [Marimonas arenosa]MDQ2089933.1 ornithine cyclodeaminase family protein [Marimonas arenosa]
MPIPHLSAADLDALALTAAEIRDALAATLRAQATGTVHAAPKTMLKPGDGRLLMTTLAADDRAGVMAVKSLVQNPANRARGLPYSDALVTALDASSGRPIATLDGGWITAHRTAALTMLAAHFLARDNATTAGFLGAGVQAQSHLAALVQLYPLTHLRIHSRSAPDRLAGHARALGLSVEITGSPRAAIAGADIVISAMSRDTPDTGGLDASWLSPGSFASLVDLGHTWARAPLGRLDALVLDDLAQERSLAADTRLAPLEVVAGDLADLVAGRLPPRQDPDQRFAFLFRGPASADLSLTALALQKAGLVASDPG